MRRSSTPPPSSGAPPRGLIDPEARFVLPVRKPPPSRGPFPLIGCAAPLLVAGVMWTITNSPFVMVFALLSPVVALAGMIDGGVHLRRERRANARLFDAQVAEFLRDVADFHAEERRVLEQSAPPASASLAGGVRVFSQTDAAMLPVRLGTGSRRSAIGLSGGETRPDPAERALRRRAVTLEGAPLHAPVPCRIALVGPCALTRPIARGYLVQLLSALAPSSGLLLRRGSAAQGSGWLWLHGLPHRGEDSVVVLEERERAARSPAGAVDPPGEHSPHRTARITLVDADELVPPESTVVIRVSGATSASIVRHPDPAFLGPISCEFVSESDAGRFALALRDRAAGAAQAGAELPDEIESHELGEPEPEGAGRVCSLSALVGVGRAGPVAVDLVSQGPHALVGGTTGSGKSELLITWVAALASRYPPDRVTVLLVDFKGGSSFDPLVSLDHCVGLITDLDPRAALRALSSLRAEIRFRERLLREAGVRDISDLAGAVLPRLVIVVDEFAAMVGEFPQLHEAFADIAARGRSLGMHLILCTQRPAGVVRDALLANCDLRFCLRVNNPGDSVALVGSPAASRLTARRRGRCYVSIGGAEAAELQIARTSRSALEAIARGNSTPRRPWLEPLPRVIPLSSLRRERPPDSGAFVIGRFDVPEEQAQPLALYDPAVHGSLLVLGARGAGKSALLQGLLCGAGSRMFRLPADVEGAWDALEWLCALSSGAITEPRPPVPVLIDDVDVMLSRFDAEYQPELVQSLTMLLRSGPSCGIVTVATAQRLAGPLTGLAALFPERILLRLPSRQEHLLAEGASSDYDAALPAGAGFWRGQRMQLAYPDSAEAAPVPGARISGRRPPGAHAPGRIDPPPESMLVVTTRPRAFLGHRGPATPPGIRLVDISDPEAAHGLLAPGGGPKPGPDSPVRLIGDPDAWQANWALLTQWRSRLPTLFDSCTLAEFRAISGRRELPPPIDPGREKRWLVEADGRTVRRA